MEKGFDIDARLLMSVHMFDAGAWRHVAASAFFSHSQELQKEMGWDVNARLLMECFCQIWCRDFQQAGA